MRLVEVVWLWESFTEVHIRKETEVGPDKMAIFTFHLENVRTETRTRHISSVISLYTFQGRIVMIIMRRILVVVDESIRTWLSVTLVLNLCQSGEKWLKPSKVSNKLKKYKSWWNIKVTLELSRKDNKIIAKSVWIFFWLRFLHCY